MAIGLRRRAEAGRAFVALAMTICFAFLHAPALRSQPPTFEAVRPAERIVIIVSIDGLRPDAWREAPTPTLDRLAAAGAATDRARTCFPPHTLPCHASLLTSRRPARHGITSGRPGRGRLKEPTLFAWLRDAGYATTAIVSKTKLHRLFHQTKVGHLERRRSARVMKRARRLIEQGRRGLFFLHLAEVDAVGHERAWMSEEQLEAVELMDRYLGDLVDFVRTKGLARQTSWIVVSDHGGHGLVHGYDRAQDMEIPLIFSGAGVRRGAFLGEGVSILDVAPTALALLGLPAVPPASGKVLRGVLSREKLLGPRAKRLSKHDILLSALPEAEPFRWRAAWRVAKSDPRRQEGARSSGKGGRP